MELIQIIESTVFIFSLGLIILLILSFLLFKVKNHSADSPFLINKKLQNESNIIYENPAEEKSENETQEIKKNNRYIVVNEVMKNLQLKEEKNRKQKLTTRYYIYKPAKKKIINKPKLSGIEK